MRRATALSPTRGDLTSSCTSVRFRETVSNRSPRATRWSSRSCRGRKGRRPLKSRSPDRPRAQRALEGNMQERDHATPRAPVFRRELPGGGYVVIGVERPTRERAVPRTCVWVERRADDDRNADYKD